MRILVPATVIVLALTSAAMAQNNRGGRDPYFALTGTAARDGCVNVPGIPHNSADCSRIPLSDLNSIVNNDSSDMGGRETGATENAARNRRILEEMRRAGAR